MQNQIKVHGDNSELLFKEVSKDLVPSDFGGEGMSCDELAGKLIFDFLLFLLKSFCFTNSLLEEEMRG